MKRTLILSLTAILFIMGGNAFAAEWAIDKAHSNVGFEVKHMMFTTVPGKFTDYTGTISLDPKDLSTTSVNFTVQAASITTANDQRDTHLKSADFFDVATYPTLTFQSKKVNAMGPGMFDSRRHQGSDVHGGRIRYSDHVHGLKPDRWKSDSNH
jgi:polyisoprenoid-binding protein YceI